jgi:hypothetical protein
MSAALQIKAELPPDNDTALLLGMIEGETDALELMDRLAEAAIADKALADKASERAARLKERAEGHREVIRRMLEALEISKLERALYTASISHIRKPIVTDEAELPEAFIRRSPDLTLIGKALRAGGSVAGAELSNDRPSLTLRTA